jgi:hypothetical protein
MTLGETLSAIDSLVGKPITVNGRIVITSDDKAFLASSLDEFEEERRLSVRDGERIARYLLATLPPYGGGPCLYDEECTVSGTIRRDRGSLEFCDLRDCLVRRDDLELEIPLSRVPG